MQTPQNPGNSQNSNPVTPRLPEMVGATSAPVRPGAATSEVSIAIQAPTGPALLRADGMPRRIFLNIDNVTSNIDAPSYEVYFNLPARGDPQKHLDLRVGTLSMFGLIESSRGDDKHTGDGLSYRFEVTHVYARLAAIGEWDDSQLRVSFVPEPWPYPVNVQVGRISLYFE